MGHDPIIDYRGSFRFERTPEEIWEVVRHSDRFEAWWEWLREFSLDGEALTSGSVLHGVVAPPLPYRMRLDVELVDCRRPQWLAARVHGDLRGEARLDLRPDAGSTRVDVAWMLEMMQLPLRLASRMAHPMLLWGHDRVIQSTVESFRRHVEEEAAKEDE